jgi:hypothetical protein
VIYSGVITLAYLTMVVVCGVVCDVCSPKIGTEFGDIRIVMVLISLKAVSYHGVNPLKPLMIIGIGR